MNYKKIRGILLSSHIQVSIICLIIMGLGGSMLVYAFSDSFRGSVIGLCLFGGLFFGLGALVGFKVIPAFFGALSGSDPLLRALRNDQKDYLVWVYRKEISTTLGNGTVTVGKSNNIVIYNLDGKMTEMVLSGKQSPELVIEYLTSKFEVPYVGYDYRIRAAINEKYGPQGWKEV